MHLIAIAWVYVVLMAAVAEALSPRGTVLGAFFTFVLYGVVPLAVVLYLAGTPARKRALSRAAQAQQRSADAAAAGASAGAATPGSGSEPPDGGSHAAAGGVAPVRKEP